MNSCFKYIGLFSLLAATGVAQADPLTDMISPVSDPVTFEDPRHSTELRPIFVYHEIDDSFVTEGGSAQIYALQARFKIADNLSFIATKDGYVVLKPNAVVDDSEGLADLAAGFKYSPLLEENYIVTTGLRYEIPTGKESVFQGQGDGALNPFVSAGYTVDNFNFIAGTGLRIAMDESDSSFWDLDLHADVKIGNFYPLAELSLVHVTNSGDRLPIADEGEDFFNFGSSYAAGTNIVAMGVGARYRVTDNIDLGTAYQFPLNRGDSGAAILDWRLTTDVIVRFSI